MTERVLLLIKECEASDKQLTAELGIGHGVITEWRKGRNKPGTEAIVKLADYFNVSADYLLGRTNIKSPMDIPGKKKEPHMQLVKNEGVYFMESDKALFIATLSEKIQKLVRHNSHGKYEVIEERARALAEGVERHLRGESRVALAKKAEIELELSEEEREHFTLKEVIAAAKEIRETEEAIMKSKSTADKRMNERVRLYGEISDNEIQLLDRYRQLNASGQGKVYEYTDDLVVSGKYSYEGDLRKHA